MHSGLIQHYKKYIYFLLFALYNFKPKTHLLISKLGFTTVFNRLHILFNLYIENLKTYCYFLVLMLDYTQVFFLHYSVVLPTVIDLYHFIYLFIF